MRNIHLAAAALNQTPLAWDENKRNIVAAIEEARRLGVDVLCLPELCITGYGCEDAFFSPGVQATALEVLAEVVAETRDIVVSFGLPAMHTNGIYNTACLAANGNPASGRCTPAGAVPSYREGIEELDYAD